MVTPYMLGAVVVDDPLTSGLDFGKASMVNSRNLVVPSNSDIVNRLVNTFFNITNPNNWQQFKPDSENELRTRSSRRRRSCSTTPRATRC